ncbi:ABC transporter ATP-binding protein [Paracidovorax citrulli]|uniref:ABC transporter ATP-binding protein n=1 Tax=Paracidovorax citrulli TaxID=80869 RepID=UPI00066271CB|nr:ABC transporter ATP-binding protein [Paracidovorax citrulli]QCX09844.1 Spermidine/putrescine import ATP-binding proteinPotA [Paracidovorax citrulli]UEG47161.1 ABC transporter ATP-binding protein [Paracidovorax citrulli]UMT89560.1 ABC transporter ATP-binding protein [Paracidovorax citrulli]UMT93638.1 ABC transporter ATP-binding protein [Paracidovorax citrulli]WIY35673.1 ABC transporter ATP-binding protein [Paracidovorax citrulli]
MKVTFQAIAQSYGGQRLFEQLDLTIPSGSFFTLLGPSGCGKTTLLRMLGGFVRPDAGTILFGDEDVTHVPVHRRNVGMVFQDYALFPDRSVLANVCYGLTARGVAKAEAQERALAMLRRVGLADFADRAPAALSGGQRQRVAMARALVIGPRLLLLDEPLSALDVKLRVGLRSMVRDLQREAGITTVFVTHDQEEALAMSDQIAVMDRGRIVQIGSPQDIYGRPTTAFAADFVGGANLIAIDAELSSDAAGQRRLQCGGAVLRTTSDAPVKPGSQLAVRPEDVAFCDAAGAGPDVLSGVVEHVEFRGSTTGYAVSTAVGVIRVDARTGAPARAPGRGETVALRVPPHAHIVQGA